MLYDKILFLSDCKKFFKNVSEVLEDDLEIAPEQQKLSAHPIEVEKPVQQVDSALKWCRQVIAAAKQDGSLGITEETVLITTKRALFTQEGKYYDNIITVVQQGGLEIAKLGAGALVPDVIIQKSIEQTGESYPLRELGFAVKVNKLIVAEYGPVEIPDEWDWANNQKFDFKDLGYEGFKSIRYALNAWVASKRANPNGMVNLAKKDYLSHLTDTITEQIYDQVGPQDEPASEFDILIVANLKAAILGSAIAHVLGTGVVAASTESNNTWQLSNQLEEGQTVGVIMSETLEATEQLANLVLSSGASIKFILDIGIGAKRLSNVGAESSIAKLKRITAF